MNRIQNTEHIYAEQAKRNEPTKISFDHFQVPVKPSKKGITNPRQYLISLFVAPLKQAHRAYNEQLEREGKKKRPALTDKRIAMKMGHIETGELHYFFRKCEGASCGFSRAFWGSLKV